MEIELLNSALEAVKPAANRMWHLAEVVADRLYGSCGENGEAALFLAGNLETFGMLPCSASIEHSDNIISVPEGRTIAALRILSNDALNGRRVIAHILYEMERLMACDATISNSELISRIEWLLPLLGDPPRLLSPEKQRGLVCECLLLRRMLQECRNIGLPPQTALDRWWGPERAKRDFAALGIAIEVKSTAHVTRRHHFNSLDQLDPQEEGEEGYLFSVGLRSDPTAPRKVGRFIQDVEELLCDRTGRTDEPAREHFRRKLRSYGLSYETVHQYDSEPGLLVPHLIPALFRITDLDRLKLTSFVNSKLPSMVVSVSFDLDIACDPLTESEGTDVIRRLLRTKSVSHKL